MPVEPTKEMIDRGVAFALNVALTLNVSLSGEYKWSQYVRDLYMHMASASSAMDEAAIRADEREKCARIAEAEAARWHDGSSARVAAANIRMAGRLALEQNKKEG